MSNDAIVMVADAIAPVIDEGPSWGSCPERYGMLLFPLDIPFHRKGMASGEESCGLTCEAILRGAEVDGTLRGRDGLRVPYASRLGSTVAYQRELGQARGCWHDASRHAPGDPLPRPGDMVELAGPAHVLTVVRELPHGGLETVEGGQVDPLNGGRCTAILRKRRVLSVRGARLYLDERPVTGWLRAGALPCRP
jgi:hypothetical protein